MLSWKDVLLLNFYDDKEKKKAYEVGENVGYKKGLDEGLKQGGKIGFAAGRVTGYETWHEEGRKKGYKDGYSKGHTKGEKKGINAGEQAGYERCYQEGFEKGKYVGLKERREGEIMEYIINNVLPGCLAATCFVALIARRTGYNKGVRKTLEQYASKN